MMMTTAAKKALTAIAVATSLTACDYVREREYKGERSDRHYQAAMADYTAGRIDAAISGFERSLRANPGNSAARFQLACLLQDRRQDYEGAASCYREFLFQEPESDKARLAKDRMAICEKQLAKALAKKHGLGGDGATAEELDRLGREAAELKSARARLESELEKAKGEIAKLNGENARLRRMMSGIGGDDDARAAARGVSAALAAGDDEEGDRLAGIPREVAELAEDDEGAPAKSALLAEPEDRGEGAAPSASPRAGQKLTDLAAAARKPRKQPDEPPHESRPATYTVQEGDTLYRIAVRFYGKMGAWTKIRDANKATVTTDGRIRAGQVLVLP